MKKILFMFLLTSGMYAQQVYNVQQYCIDELPLQKSECDLKGNEYSFVFVDAKKNDVAFFLTDKKFKYQIISTKAVGDATQYRLKNELGDASMTINRAGTKIDFVYPNRTISLVVGKSTKKQ